MSLILRDAMTMIGSPYHRFRKWHSCDPTDLLKMDTPVVKFIAEDKKNLEALLREEGRRAECVPCPQPSTAF